MKNLIRKSEKFIIGGFYAITAFMLIWVDGVKTHLELWNETATKVLTFVIYYVIVINGFIFFTAVQRLTHKSAVKYPA